MGLHLSHVSCPLDLFASSFDWFTGLFASFVIDKSVAKLGKIPLPSRRAENFSRSSNVKT